MKWHSTCGQRTAFRSRALSTQGLDSGWQAWWWVPLPTKPSFLIPSQPTFLPFLRVSHYVVLAALCLPSAV